MESDTSSTAAESVDSVGFGISFVLIVGISAVEALASIVWTRIHVSLGISGLVLIPTSPQTLLDTLQDVNAPMTLETYLTLLMLWWILGVLLLIAMLPLCNQDRRIHLLGWPGLVALVVASTANAVLLGLGCWKIDYGRRNGLDSTPMLSYWIGGASAISCSCRGIAIFQTFRFLGLVLMLLDTF